MDDVTRGKWDRASAGFDLQGPCEESAWKGKGSALIVLPTDMETSGRSKVAYVTTQGGTRVEATGSGSYNLPPHLFFKDPFGRETARAGVGDKADCSRAILLSGRGVWDSIESTK